jgi:hypothetical protein
MIAPIAKPAPANHNQVGRERTIHTAGLLTCHDLAAAYDDCDCW